MFEQASREKSVILRIHQEEQAEIASTDVVAKELLGRSVYVSWPHLVEAL